MLAQCCHTQATVLLLEFGDKKVLEKEKENKKEPLHFNTIAMPASIRRQAKTSAHKRDGASAFSVAEACECVPACLRACVPA